MDYYSALRVPVDSRAVDLSITVELAWNYGGGFGAFQGRERPLGGAGDENRTRTVSLGS